MGHILFDKGRVIFVILRDSNGYLLIMASVDNGLLFQGEWELNEI